VSKGRRVALLSEFVAGGHRVAVCAHEPPASEAEVQEKILEMLRARGCVQLDDFTDAVTLPNDTLVVIDTSARINIQRSGIDRGLSDLLLCRVGRWTWRMVEVKKRGIKGRCAGRISVAQDTAQRSKISEIVWSVEHIRELIARLDRENA
jgi:hypothetical protein